MSKHKQFQPESPWKRIRKYLLSILFFPAVVTKRYKIYHIGLYTMIDSFNFGYASKIVSFNIRRINLLIRLPLAVGVLATAFLFFSNTDEMSKSLKSVKKMYKLNINKRTILKPSQLIKRTSHKAPTYFWVFYPLLGGYALCLAGSALMSLNPAFNEEKKISKVLQLHRYIDDEGEPWKVSWTPYGIIFFGYNCDPNTVKANIKFWNTLNFQPDDPKVHEKDSSIFMFKRAYELPSKIPLDLKPLIKEKLAKKLPLPEIVTEEAPTDEAGEEELEDIADHEESLEEIDEESGETFAEEKESPLSFLTKINLPVQIEFRSKKRKKVFVNPLAFLKGGNKKLIYKPKHRKPPEPEKDKSLPEVTTFNIPNKPPRKKA